MSEWLFYFPDDGETADSGRSFGRARILDAEDAAKIACGYGFNPRDGWARGRTAFTIVIIDPYGAEHKFRGWLEPSVEHITGDRK